MFGYSHVKYEIFKFSKKQLQKIKPKVKIETKLLRLDEVTALQWKQLRKLQGRFAVSYLKWKYGSQNTHILLAFAQGKLAHVEWIVPAKKIHNRYPFVTKNSNLIISCLTAPDFRGQRIYPSQLQNAIQSDIPTQAYWGLAAIDNIPSLKGIDKAGGIKMGEFVQKKWFWGCFAKAKYYPLGDNSK